MERQTRIPKARGRKNHDEHEKAKEKESTTCKLGRFVCFCEVQKTRKVAKNLMMTVKFVSYKGLMASNGNVLGVICRCSIKSKMCEDIDKSRKEVSHV